MQIKRYRKFLHLFTRLFFFTTNYAIGLMFLRIFTIILPVVRVLAISFLVNDIQLVSENVKDISKLWLPICFILGIEFTNGLVSAFSQALEKKCAITLKKIKFPELIKHIAKLDYACFEQKETLDLIERVKKNYIPKIMSAFTTTLYFIESILVALGMVIILSTQVGLWAFALLLISIPLIIAGQKSGDEMYQGEVNAENHQRYLEYIESLYSKREYANERQIFSYQKSINKIWKLSFQRANRYNEKIKKKIYLQMCFSNILTFAGYATSIGLLCLFLIKGMVTYGFFISITISVLRLMYTLSYSLSWDIAEMRRIRAFADDYAEFQGLPIKKGADKEIRELTDFTFESLEFKNVTFSYPNSNRTILKNLSFKLEKGKRYAFVGENGVGKTTITKLLLGLYEPNAGEIMINGKPIKEYEYDYLRGIFSVAFQDYSKYEINVSDSISLARPEANEEEIVDALKFVGMDSFMEHDDDFLRKELGKLTKESIDLSGGQWQRLAIARTILSNRMVFILDEVTASIDPIQERDIYKLFEKTSNHKTTIFITHRLGSTKFVDCILVLKEGNIAEMGNHVQLMETNGYYAHMYREQSRWYS